MNRGDQTAAAHSKTIRVVLAGVCGLIILGVAYMIWPRSAPPVPPVPAGLEDEEVVEVLEDARNEVIARPYSAEKWGELGLAFMASLFDQEAKRCFAQAAELDPDDGRWFYAQAIVASKRTPDQTVPLLRSAVEAERPGDEFRSAAKLMLAETLLEQRELDEAEALFREFLSSKADRARAVLGLGLVAQARDDRKAAREYLTEAREHPSSRKQATLQLAVITRVQGDVDEANRLQQETTQLSGDKSWPDPLSQELRRYKVGRRARERMIADLENRRDFEGAARAYLEQIDDKPTAKAYLGAAANFARLREYEAADELISRALLLEKDSSQAYYTRALVYFIQAERQLAEGAEFSGTEDLLKKVVENAKVATQLKADHAQAYLMWGLALKHVGKPEEAIDPLSRGAACRPNAFDLQFALGEALLDSGQATEAKKTLENARRLNPSDPRLERALARLEKQ